MVGTAYGQEAAGTESPLPEQIGEIAGVAKEKIQEIARTEEAVTASKTVVEARRWGPTLEYCRTVLSR